MPTVTRHRRHTAVHTHLHLCIYTQRLAVYFLLVVLVIRLVLLSPARRYYR